MEHRNVRARAHTHTHTHNFVHESICSGGLESWGLDLQICICAKEYLQEIIKLDILVPKVRYFSTRSIWRSHFSYGMRWTKYKALQTRLMCILSVLQR